MLVVKNPKEHAFFIQTRSQFDNIKTSDRARWSVFPRLKFRIEIPYITHALRVLFESQTE